VAYYHCFPETSGPFTMTSVTFMKDPCGIYSSPGVERYCRPTYWNRPLGQVELGPAVRAPPGSQLATQVRRPEL
jgi:hypothetical protein